MIIQNCIAMSAIRISIQPNLNDAKKNVIKTDSITTTVLLRHSP
uniref:Uncharacterized protein n=1 Tax=Myoviridae sp. ct1CM14 TaxID=2825018 RepID=A0A8S5NTJ6_9CAUD|nr:MAG TPA: hypothetical protein [Myoviridae sp. ct1CM14]